MARLAGNAPSGAFARKCTRRLNGTGLETTLAQDPHPQRNEREHDRQGDEQVSRLRSHDTKALPSGTQNHRSSPPERRPLTSRRQRRLPGTVMNHSCRGPAVVTLHGIGRTPFDMWPMAEALRRAGFAVLNWGYPSRRASILELAEKLGEVTKRLSDAPAVHFVGHSMGGLVARALLTSAPPANVGRLVMIGSPNAGSCVAEFFGDWRWYRWLFGPAGQDLRRGPRGICSLLGTPQCEFGIIAGATGHHWGMNPLLGSDNDSLVTLAETWLEGARDFVILPYPHAIIQFFPRTIRNTISFLLHGRFLEGCGRNTRVCDGGTRARG